jgi:hypothetical protein
MHSFDFVGKTCFDDALATRRRYSGKLARDYNDLPGDSAFLRKAAKVESGSPAPLVTL